MAEKMYANADYYERKLAKIMADLEIEKYNWDYNRRGSWVEFFYKGQLYRFEHSVENAQNHGVKLQYGSDAFAQIVLALEDLKRIINRGIYDLQNWVAGMKALPEATQLPNFYQYLGFTEYPKSEEDIKKAYRNLAQTVHPDKGGNDEDFTQLTNAYNTALKFFTSGGK